MDADVPYIGQIVPTAANFVPDNWLGCNGQQLNIMQFQALYSLIANMYGGTYASGKFNLPDLRGRLVCGIGASVAYGAVITVAETFGQSTATLSPSNLPTHGHGVNLTLSVGVDYTTANGTNSAPAGGGLLATAVAGTTTTTVDVYAPVSATSPVTSILPTTLTGTPTITAGPAGGGTNGVTTPISLTQPTLAMYLCIATQGEYPVSV